MKDRNELPEGWEFEFWSGHAYVLHSIRASRVADSAHTNWFMNSADAIAAAWRIVDAEAAKETTP